MTIQQETRVLILCLCPPQLKLEQSRCTVVCSFWRPDEMKRGGDFVAINRVEPPPAKPAWRPLLLQLHRLLKSVHERLLAAPWHPRSSPSIPHSSTIVVHEHRYMCWTAPIFYTIDFVKVNKNGQNRPNGKVEVVFEMTKFVWITTATHEDKWCNNLVITQSECYDIYSNSLIILSLY